MNTHDDNDWYVAKWKNRGRNERGNCARGCTLGNSQPGSLRSRCGIRKITGVYSRGRRQGKEDSHCVVIDYKTDPNTKHDYRRSIRTRMLRYDQDKGEEKTEKKGVETEEQVFASNRRKITRTVHLPL